MSDERILLTPYQATGLLCDGVEYIHNYANPAGGMLIGIDYTRPAAVAAFQNAVQIEIGGPACKRSRHPIIVWDSPTHHTFFEADMDKVNALEASIGAPVGELA